MKTKKIDFNGNEGLLSHSAPPCRWNRKDFPGKSNLHKNSNKEKFIQAVVSSNLAATLLNGLTVHIVYSMDKCHSI